MTEPTPFADARAELLAPAFLDGLDDRPVADLRAMRDRAEAEEHRVSYARRILQGRIDLLRAEVDSRGAGQHVAFQDLGTVLADQGGSGSFDPAKARAPKSVLPPDGDDDLADLPEVDLTALDPDELAQLARRYADRERELSDLRRGLFGVIDRLQDEIAERYRTGAASVGDLLADGG